MSVRILLHIDSFDSKWLIREFVCVRACIVLYAEYIVIHCDCSICGRRTAIEHGPNIP